MLDPRRHDGVVPVLCVQCCTREVMCISCARTCFDASYEHTSTRLAKEHELETNALKASFADVAEKRKVAFLQLKEKLKQAVVVVNKQTA